MEDNLKEIGEWDWRSFGIFVFYSGGFGKENWDVSKTRGYEDRVKPNPDEYINSEVARIESTYLDSNFAFKIVELRRIALHCTTHGDSVYDCSRAVVSPHF